MSQQAGALDIAGKPQTSASVIDPPPLELMTLEQRQDFLRKDRARILIANGVMTLEQAIAENLITAKEGEQLQASSFASISHIAQPSAPQGAESGGGKKCC